MRALQNRLRSGEFDSVLSAPVFPAIPIPAPTLTAAGLDAAQQASWVYGTFSVLFGLAVGSFLNVVVHRLPDGGWKSLNGRSMCPRCGAPIRWFDNIPVIAWLWLRAKCRECGLPISGRYPLIEITGGLLFFWAWSVGTTPEYTLDLVVRWIFLASLLALSVIDFDLTILPDELTIPGMYLGPLLTLVAPSAIRDTWSYRWLAEWIPNATIRTLAVSVAGVAVGAGSVALIRFAGTRFYSSKEKYIVGGADAGQRLDAFLAQREMKRSRNEIRRLAADGAVRKRTGSGSVVVAVDDLDARVESGSEYSIHVEREAMGFGDVKLQGAVGAFVGPEGSLLALATASVLGALVGVANIARLYLLLIQRRRTRSLASGALRPERASPLTVARIAGRTIPFGPFLAGGGALVFLHRGRLITFFSPWLVVH